MGKSLRKILATVLTFCMVATFCAVPMTANAEAPADETYEAYDVINYLDLKDASGNALAATGTNMSGAKIFTYDRTSPTGSAILKYRWTVGTSYDAQISIGTAKSAMSYLFGIWIQSPNNHAWIINGSQSQVPLSFTFEPGSIHDIEFGRLKIKAGNNVGKYYVYYKVDGQLITYTYVGANVVDADGNYTDKGTACSVKSGEIFLQVAGTGNKISQIPDYEYEKYDTVTYWNLTDASGNALAETGTNMASDTILKYAPTSSTGSAILNYRVSIGNTNGYAPFQISFEKSQNGTPNYKFGAFFEAPTDTYPNGDVWIFANNEKFSLPFAIQTNTPYDIEFARLKIKSGRNAGNYYVYFKINNTLVAEKYVDGTIVDSNGKYKTNNGTTDVSVLSGEICYSCHGVSGTVISAIPENETYDTFDEITLSNLGLNPGIFANELPNDTLSSYSATSASYSYVLKFNWRANLEPGTGDEWCVSPDGQYNHGKGLWIRGQNFLFGYPNGPKTILPAITSGDHLIEFGRKKVLNGKNLGKYYIYVKVDDVQLADGYIEYADPNNTIWIRGGALAKQRFADDGVKPHEHELTAVAATAATCKTPGNVACWYCEECKKYFKDEIGFEEYATNAWQIPVDSTAHTAGEAVQENEQKATKTSYGTYDLVVRCKDCGAELSRTTVIDTSKLPLDMIIGTQTKENETRLIMKLTDTADVIQSYKKVGFIVTVNGVEQSVELDGVYTGFYNIEEGGEVKEYTATELGCTYVSILEINDITEAETVTVQGFFIDDEGKTTLGAIRTLKK